MKLESIVLDSHDTFEDILTNLISSEDTDEAEEDLDFDEDTRAGEM